MKIKTKAFTLIELILILLIVGIMFRIWYFAYEKDKINKEILEGQQCANSIFWQISEYINLAKKKQSIYIDTNTSIYPKYYVVEFSWSTIDLKYTTDGTNYFLYDSLINPMNMCFVDSVTYNIDTNVSIQITPWFKSNEIGNLSSFNINNLEWPYSWSIIFQKCENNWICYQIAKFTTNSKTNEIIKSICWEYWDTGLCSKWR